MRLISEHGCVLDRRGERYGHWICKNQELPLGEDAGVREKLCVPCRSMVALSVWIWVVAGTPPGSCPSTLELRSGVAARRREGRGHHGWPCRGDAAAPEQEEGEESSGAPTQEEGEESSRGTGSCDTHGAGHGLGRGEPQQIGRAHV